MDLSGQLFLLRMSMQRLPVASCNPDLAASLQICKNESSMTRTARLKEEELRPVYQRMGSIHSRALDVKMNPAQASKASWRYEHPGTATKGHRERGPRRECTTILLSRFGLSSDIQVLCEACGVACRGLLFNWIQSRLITST